MATTEDMNTINCAGWDVASFCCHISYTRSGQYPIQCTIHKCDAWKCFSASPLPSGEGCESCRAELKSTEL